MKTMLTIAIHELKVMFRRRVFRIITMGLPIIALVALLVVWVVQTRDTGEVKEEQVGYVDGTGLFTESRTQGKVEFVLYPTRDAGMEALLAEEIKRLYVIPPDYLASGVVQRYEVSQGLDLGNEAAPALRAFLLDNLAGSNLPPNVVERLKDPLNLASVKVDSQGDPRQVDPGRVVFFIFLAILLIASIMMTGGFVLQGLVEEKESRIMEILLSSVTPGQLMAGKILGLGAAGLTQMLIWVVSGFIILKVIPSFVPDFPVEVPGVTLVLVAVLFFVLGYLFFATLMAGVGAVASTAREGSQLSFIFVIPVIVPIYATTWIIGHPTAAVTRSLTLFPFTSPIVVLQRLGSGAIEPWEVAASLGMLALSVAVAMFLVVRIFRSYLLMYGKRPGLRELARTLVRA